jgi:hypothetical protein
VLFFVAMLKFLTAAFTEHLTKRLELYGVACGVRRSSGLTIEEIPPR